MRFYVLLGVFLFSPQFALADVRTGTSLTSVSRNRDAIDVMMVENALRAFTTLASTAKAELKRAEGDLVYFQELFELEKAVYDRGASSDERYEEAGLKVDCARWKVDEFRGKLRAAQAEMGIWQQKLEEELGKKGNPVSLAESYTHLWKARLDTAKSEISYYEAQDTFWTKLHVRRQKLAAHKAVSKEDLLKALAARDDMRGNLEVANERKNEAEGFWKASLADLENAKKQAETETAPPPKP